MEQYRQTSPLLIIIALVIGAMIGYLIGALTADTQMSTSIQEAGDKVQDSLEQTISNDDTSTTGAAATSDQVDSTLVAGSASEAAFTIPFTSLDSAQQVILRGMGIEGDSIVVTKGMVVCAEAEMGTARVVEIQNGSSISMSEGMTLVGCYSAD